MSDEPESVVLELVRRLDQRTETVSVRLDHVMEIVGRIAQNTAEVKIGIAALHAGCDQVNRTLDRIDAKLDRIGGARWTRE